MGVIYFLICVRKHKSNLPANNRTTEGGETQWYTEKCDLLSETTFLPYFMIAWCVFFYQSVCFFTNGVTVMFSITTLCFYVFCETVLVKKYTPCQGMIWFSPTKCHNCYTGFYVHVVPSTLTTQLKPMCIKPQNNIKKWLEGAAPELQLLHVHLQSKINLHWLCNLSNINTHFDMFLKN